jgi:AraC family transcriptional activator of pyochelin receptor
MPGEDRVDAGTDFIVVSPEMTAILREGVVNAPIPPRAVEFSVAPGPQVWTLQYDPTPRVVGVLGRADRIVFLVQRDAMERLGGAGLLTCGVAGFHLTAELRAIALALREPAAGNAARATYQLAKGIEFMCEAIRQFRAGELVSLAGEGELSPADTRRMIAARQMIMDRAQEKLSLDYIARSCGLNRSKLTRGFKALFDCTVTQAIAERRLELASRMLLTTDRPVSTIGYESGYLNNASFARAFGRRYGRSPSDFRCGELAA